MPIDWKALSVTAAVIFVLGYFAFFIQDTTVRVVVRMAITAGAFLGIYFPMARARRRR